ncbi:MAG: hypothetical protein JNL21_41965 [Myxococcales bacterium]|nr:hypothetical protein [Myxococcales bacterium]
MATVEQLLAEMASNPAGVRFTDACKVATHFFGKARIRGSHHVWSMNWAGDPRVNLQEGKGNLAKAYQVKQLLAAVEKEQQRLDVEAKKTEAAPLEPKPKAASAKGPKKIKKPSRKR